MTLSDSTRDSAAQPLRRAAARLAVGVLAFTFGCQSASPEVAAPVGPSPAECEPCLAAILANDRCQECGTAYVAGVRVPSEMLHEALDAHGHEINPESLQCERCRTAFAESEYCRKHGWGFVGGQLYFSRLTYLLARGRAVDPASISCRHCREHMTEPGWCEACGRGMVGNVVFEDSTLHDQATEEYAHLLACIETLERCEQCAVARFFGSRCPTCDVSYPRRGRQPRERHGHRHDGAAHD